MSQEGGSRVALITNQFDAMRAFYAGRLGFNELETWDRPRARGIILQGPGSFRLELLDATREEPPLDPGPPSMRAHLVLELDDLAAWYQNQQGKTAPTEETTWGGKVVLLEDPDGTPVWLRQAPR